MDRNNGTGTGVEPEVKGAPETDGKEQQGLGQPEGTQSTGENTLEGVKGTASPAWMAQLPNDLKNEPTSSSTQRWRISYAVRGARLMGARDLRATRRERSP